MMVKLGMTNPPYLRPILPQLATLLTHKNVFSYLHIPVQVIVPASFLSSRVPTPCCVA